MTTEQHPITPSEGLIEALRSQAPQCDVDAGVNKVRETQLVIAAYRAGADQELEACCKLLDGCTVIPVDGYASTAQNRLAAVDRVARLCAARRPKPPSLVEEARAKLDEAVMRGDCISTTTAMPILRAALERLQELEKGNE